MKKLFMYVIMMILTVLFYAIKAITLDTAMIINCIGMMWAFGEEK